MARKSRKTQINPKAAHYRLKIKRSPLHRHGVFALEDIPSGRPVIEYTGKRINRDLAWKIRPPNDTYLAGMNDRWVLDGRSGGSGAQFVNHSCNPNLEWRCLGNQLFLVSRKKIRSGEELTVTYRYLVNLKRVACRCGQPRCRGTLRFILS